MHVFMRLVFPSALCLVATYPKYYIVTYGTLLAWPLEPTKRNLKRGKGPLAIWAALALRVQGPGWARPQCGNRNLNGNPGRLGTGRAIQ